MLYLERKKMKKVKENKWVFLSIFAIVFGFSQGLEAKKSLMNQGYDVVSYYKMMEKIQSKEGNIKYKTDHEGKTYYFISDKNRQEFISDPQRYAIPYARIGIKKHDVVAYHGEKEENEPHQRK